MDEEKKSIDNVEFPAVKSPESECKEKWIKKTAQKRRVIVTSCIVACVLIAVVSVVTLLKLQNVCGGALVAVNLKEGDVLTYQVNQTFQINGTNNQKETISSSVGLKVVNKTSEIYLFLVKIISISKAETDRPKIVPVTTYFHVRLYRKETSSNEYESGPFDVYGDPKTDPEYVRYIHGVLYQLLPSVNRDLYEEIDGKTGNKDIPENLHLFPGPVRMQRKANTTQPDHVSIKSHFNRSDFVNSSSDVDVDMHYANYASLNKTNGMMSESDVTLYEQLKFGKTMKTKDDHDVTMMNINVHSHVTRIEIEGFFKQKEIDAVEIHLFAKLEIPVSDDKIKVFDASLTTSRPSTTFSNDDRVSTHPSTLRGRKRREMDTAPKRRVRRNAVVSHVFDQMRRQGAMMTVPNIDKTYKLFEEKVIGVNVKGQALQSLQYRLGDRFKVGVGLQLAIGSKFFEVYKKEFDNEDLDERRLDKKISKTFGVSVPVCVTVYIVELCVDFSLDVSFSIRFRLIPEKTALVPLQFAAEVIPSSSLIVSVEAYATVRNVRGGVYVDGTLVRATLPFLISYNRAAKQTEDWCLTNGLELTALEVETGLFYQRKKCSVSWPVVSCDWGSRNIVLRFGKWSAIKKHYNLLEQCF